LRKVAAMAEAAHLDLVPHTWGNGMGLLANLHLAAASPNCSWLEFPHDPPSGFTAASRDQMLRETLSIDADGKLPVPDRPGFGFILDEDRIAHHTIAEYG
jgi:L-alanine-DL-glutamate epimerase-like enolase superfamily enzyme